ncbi:FAD-binding oxidoreductase, partial [Ramlibacter sp.]|uniref:FAD-binding oxidoreductase n=1 Tax=Ramlibacter sp. TaxID=1917967 RepID=UPI0017E300C4
PSGCLAGGCGSCRAQVLAGDYTLGDTPALAQAERDAGQVLLCRTFARGDLRLRLLENAPQPLHAALVEDIAYPSDDVAVLRLRMLGAPLVFCAGQFVRLCLKDGTARNYSIASAEDAPDTIALHIRHVPQGACSSRFFGEARIRPGMKIRLQGPLGGFTLRSEGNNSSGVPRVFLATGTGYAPVHAMLLALRRQGSAPRTTFYWGGQRLRDLYAAEEAAALLRDIGGRFVPVLAAEERPGTRSGFVQQAVLQDHPDLRGAQVYACGNPAMVEAAAQALCNHAGLPPTSFFADAFLPNR